MIRFSFSSDGGTNWRSIWETGEELGAIHLQQVGFCDPFDPSKEERPKTITPFGMYDFLIKIELEAKKDVSDTGVDEFSVTTVFQHNIFVLPMLWPGSNKITASGEVDPRSRLRVTYVWDDLEAQDRTHTAEVDSTPLCYKIFAKGQKWDDVVCRSITMSVLPKKASHKRLTPSISAPIRPQEGLTAYVYPTERSIGKSYTKPIESPQHYIQGLQRQLEAQRNLGTSNIPLKKLSKKIGRNILALAALRDPSARQVLEEVIKSDTTHPFRNKVRACQALYQCAGDSAAPMMIKILERDQAIRWRNGPKKRSQEAAWLRTTSMAAAILAKIKAFEGKERAADLVAGILEGRKTKTDPRTTKRGKEICWGLIRALGKLGNRKHIPVLKSFLTERSDATAVAVRAIGDIGDSSVIPDIVSLLKNFKYSPIGLYSIEVLGELGTHSLGHHLYPFLGHWDEDFRGTAATALGNMGDQKAIPELEEMLKKETFPWVLSAAKRSIRMLKRQTP
jgi:hypothetical protein